MGRSSIKKYGYPEGKESIEKRLDIVKIVKTSVDLDVLKKLYLLPRQRNLFKKQRRGAVKVDSSESSAPDTDSDKDCQIFEANNGKSIMNADLKNTTDRRLLLGIIHRDNDLEPRSLRSNPSADASRNIQMTDVSSTGFKVVQDINASGKM